LLDAAVCVRIVASPRLDYASQQRKEGRIMATRRIVFASSYSVASLFLGSAIAQALSKNTTKRRREKLEKARSRM